METIQKICSFTDHQGSIESRVDLYVDILRDLLSTTTSENDLSDVIPSDKKNVFRDRCIEIEILLEKITSSNKSVIPELKEIYIPFYSRVCDFETKLIAKFSEIKETCFVGCGSMPLSLLLFSKRNGTSVTGIDYQQECIQNAQHFISERHQLKKDFDVSNISLIHCSGEVFDYGRFKNIILPASISEAVKKTIFYQIIHTNQNTMQYIFHRRPRGIGKIFYGECVSFRLLDSNVEYLGQYENGILSVEVLKIEGTKNGK